MPGVRRGAAVLAALWVTAALAACGATTSVGGAGAASGAKVFAKDCSACHSLIGNESLHRQGGDLENFRISHRDLLLFTREMPTRRRLNPEQMMAVVAYVMAAEQHHR
ncbi:MAG: c-type cytochrome [Solirubrobacteraceae bacterium]